MSDHDQVASKTGKARPCTSTLAQPLFERPGIRPARLPDLLRDIGQHYISNGIVGLVFSASGLGALELEGAAALRECGWVRTGGAR